MDNANNENSNRDNSSNLDVEGIGIPEDNQSNLASNSNETASEVPEQLKPYAWKKGQSGNPEGRPKDPVRTFLREEFYNMSKEELRDYCEKLTAEFKVKHTEAPMPTTLAGDQENPLQIITVNSKLAEMYGIRITQPPGGDSDK